MKTPDQATLEALYSALRYDPETGELTWARDISRRVKQSDPAGSLNRAGLRVVRFQGKVHQASHVAWYLHKDEWPNSPILYRDWDPSNLAFKNLHLQSTGYVQGSRAGYMRDYRAFKRMQEGLDPTKAPKLPLSRFDNVRPSGDRKVWTAYAPWDSRVILASFAKQKEAETYTELVTYGRQFCKDNPSADYTDEEADRRAGGPQTLTLWDATERFAYDPETGAIFRRNYPGRLSDLEGTPAIETDANRRPIIRASGRTYSAGMLAWFIHTKGDWPPRKRLGYRDGNRKNLKAANLYLKGSE